MRIKGVGGNVEKLRVVVVPKKPRLGPPVLLLIAAIITARDHSALIDATSARQTPAGGIAVGMAVSLKAA